MSARKTRSLAYPEYVSPDPQNSVQVSRARLLLFETVKNIYPEMLKALSTTVFPLFERLADANYTFLGMYGWQGLSPFELLAQVSIGRAAGFRADTSASATQRKRLKLAVGKWAAEFYLTEAWAKDEAVRTLWYWHSDPEGRASLRWNPYYGHSSTIASAGEPFLPQFSPWETELVSWSRYKKYVYMDFEKQLRIYEKASRKVAESCGLQRGRRQHSAANFDSFVLYQFAGMSYANIAKGQQLLDAESTIRKGVETVRKLVAWDTLRPARGNRKTR